jgi:hypothetical protein
MQRTLGMILLAVLVVFAGCGGVLGGDDGSDTVETFTPAAVPTDEPTPTPVPQLAPGLTGEGIENASALVIAHTSVLQNQSFTMTTNATGLASNSSVIVRSTSTLRAGPVGEGIYSVSERNGSYGYSNFEFPVRTEVWSDGERLFLKRAYANGTTTYEQQRTYGRFGAGGAGLLYRLEPFGTANTSVVERERNGTTLYFVRGRIQGDGRNMSLRLLVDSRGVIHSYRTVRQGAFEANVSRIIYETRYLEIGTTDAPERPSWVDEVMNRTTPIAEETATTNR